METNEILKNPSAIKKILGQALVENNPLQLRIDNQVFVYYSKFDSEPGLAEDIQAGKHLLIAPLDPPVGNIKVLKSKELHLELFTKSHLVSTKVKFLSRPDQDTIELSFPEEIAHGSQKRESVRVQIDPDWQLIVKAIRPSGLSFLGRPVDISMGGVCFFSLGAVPSISENTKLQVAVQWPNRNKKFLAKAILIKNFRKEGDVYFRTKFLLETYKDARAVEEMVTALQILEIKKREEKFGIKESPQDNLPQTE
ncbi:MAG: PilZ domain-containing protein [Magnetococcales bacterium]|nr:PilZ domain-containing protein [Magnetococcales bacterium]